ncbi:hypothetical protein JW865_08110 [Candidatus Bathyarchaeota archaeon]|nr:hypothetical protein [Candidatus Bathyarchaeota archaeon]
MKKTCVLTVAESKRLIAKGLVALPEVQYSLEKGMLVVATGTTNAYVLQEILNDKFDLRRYKSGLVTPDVPEKKKEPAEEPLPDVVFKDGKIVKELDRFNAVQHMNKGDVYIKGANALDYVNQMAGVLIGGSTGGTVGAVIGNIIGKQIHLIIPIGLEKLVYEDLNELHRITMEEDFEGPRLWPITGIIFTEIEALEVLFGVQATLYAAGGVAGAEGSVRLIIEGEDEDVNDALSLIKEIKGEPRYLL